MNLFVIKQINIWKFEVTSSDALAVGYLLGLALIQEYYGTKAARNHILLSFICSIGFLLLSMVQLLYVPNHLDTSHSSFVTILSLMPRIFMASIISFLIIQFVDIFLFQKLRIKLSGKWFAGRTAICLVISQVLDTYIFTYLALYKAVPHLRDIIIFSLVIKLSVTGISLPFANLSKRIGNQEFKPKNKELQKFYNI